MEGEIDLTLLYTLDTPVFAVDRALLRQNADILRMIRLQTGVKILLALKAFSMFSTFDLLRDALDGTCASSPYEARLGRETFGKEVHSFAAAYSESDYEQVYRYSDHIVFNSMSQYARLVSLHPASERTFGLRINPQHREAETALYDPCAPYSRLGIIREQMPAKLPDAVTGLHFHTLCEQDSGALERTWRAAERQFAEYFHECSWINLGGGHHITKSTYDRDHLCALITEIQERYKCTLYLEPGEAVALNTGFLVATVLDVVDNGMKIAVLDCSAAAHAPDVLEMPYRPHVIDSGMPGEKTFTYRFAGLSCLAGDLFGDYSFDHELTAGSTVIFTDMAIYSMVKTNTFNGLSLPDIVYYDSNSGTVLHKRKFGYNHFKERLS